MSAATLGLKEVQRHLPALLRTLRDRGFDTSTDQYLDVNDLLIKLATGKASPAHKYVRASLSGVFATSAQQQSEFISLFDNWVASFAQSDANRNEPPPIIPDKRQWLWRAYDKLIRIRWWLLALLIACAGYFIFYKEAVIPDNTTTTKTDEPPTTGPAPVEPTLVELQYKPRPVPARVQVPPRYDSRWAKQSRLLWVIPVSLWLAWLMSQLYRRSQVATHEGQDRLRYDLSHITLSADYQRLFAGPDLEPLWRSLRRYRHEPGNRLDVVRTVDGLIHNRGYFQPHFRSRTVSPAYLALVDRLHTEDHVAGIADEWLNKLEREQITLKRLYYRGDPRFTRLSGDTGFTREPGELTALYTDHDLLLLGDGLSLSNERTGEPLRWTQQLRNYRRGWLIVPNPLWPLGSLYRALQPLVRALPLTTTGLAQFDLKGERLAQDNPLDLPLPGIVAEDPTGWLQEYKRPASEKRALIEALRQYLGPQGYLLLAATAAYPRVYWRLTQALDQYLDLDEDSRIWRLRKIARLPWHRHGGFPQRIRYWLLRSIEPAQRKLIESVYQQLQSNVQPGVVLPLPVYTPVQEQKRQQAQRDPGDLRLESAIDAAESGEPLADPVFARVIRGRKPRLLEIELLSQALNQPGRASPDYFLRALLLGMLLLLLCVQANVWLWERVLVPISRQDALNSMLSDNSSIAVRINSQPDMQSQAVNLQQALHNYGFGDVVVADSTAGEVNESSNIEPSANSNTGANAENTENRLRYNVRADELDNLLYPVKFQLYGDIAIPNERDPTLPESTVEINLNSTARIFQDSLQDKATLLEPEMRRITQGCFLMGSPDTEFDRNTDEWQQEVCIEQDFDIGRYEVTFAQYDQFAQATDRDLPDDASWGRGQQPVIYVSWRDAVDYANWLSNETGSVYSLPTEAQWEYAARAEDNKTQPSPFNTGDCISSDQANFDSTVRYAECPVGTTEPDSTVEVGSYPPNRWGLYDMHGNVLEWTCSLFQSDNLDAATGCANREQEGNRVLRGGSWGLKAQNVRSAYRLSIVPAFRNGNVGFRVARAIR